MLISSWVNSRYGYLYEFADCSSTDNPRKGYATSLEHRPFCHAPIRTIGSNRMDMGSNIACNCHDLSFSGNNWTMATRINHCIRFSITMPITCPIFEWQLALGLLIASSSINGIDNSPFNRQLNATPTSCSGNCSVADSKNTMTASIHTSSRLWVQNSYTLGINNNNGPGWYMVAVVVCSCWTNRTP